MTPSLHYDRNKKKHFDQKSSASVAKLGNRGPQKPVGPAGLPRELETEQKSQRPKGGQPKAKGQTEERKW
jgi:hypothetical protein